MRSEPEVGQSRPSSPEVPQKASFTNKTRARFRERLKITPWWLISLGFHGLMLALVSLLTFQVVRAPVAEFITAAVCLEKAPPAESASSPANARNVLQSLHDTPPSDPTSLSASEIVVPPDILSKAELGDHFESINPDRPDTQSAFGQSEAHMFHSIEGASDSSGGGAGNNVFAEIIGIAGPAAPGSGGGYGGGMGTGVGMDTGSGSGCFGARNGGGRRLMVMRYGGASAHDRNNRGRAGIAGRAADASVNAALAWLAAQQEADGRWNTRKFSGKDHDTAVTGMALLAFLGAGHTEKAGAYKNQVKLAVTWLRQQQQADGRVGLSTSDAGYTHGIAGLGLIEAAGLGRISETVAAAERALKWSCANPQAPNGAAGPWRYNGATLEGDLSVTGWYVLQLKSAKTAGLKPPPACFENAAQFLDSVSIKLGDGPHGPILGYQYKPGNRQGSRLDAIGNLCRQLLGERPEDLADSVQNFVAKSPLPEARKPDLYYWYYGTLCTFNQGGEVWKTWNTALKKALTGSQRGDCGERGSWDPQGPYADNWGRVGQTALGALCLEVYYRYLPLVGPDGKALPAAAQAGVPPLAPPKDGPREIEPEAQNAELYADLKEKGFVRPQGDDGLSTFSIDVDTASYSNVRRMLDGNGKPPKGAVRIEELINYFDYTYAPPAQDAFAVHSEVAACPWNREHRLALIALKGKEIPWDARPACNLVFLIDVSGSMDAPNRLPLVKCALRMLVGKLEDQDRVALVVYAGNSGMVLDSTSCKNKPAILGAIDRLEAGGSTNGGAGIELAYKVAEANMIKGGANRVILCTDGDFNVGVTSHEDLLNLIQQKAKTGAFLTVLGFGMGNLKDATLELLADKGNGNYGYVDNAREAKKILVDQVGGTLLTIAKDVKIQVEFNPDRVGAYRLIGYENRVMANKDFRDDKKDAGEIGSGHAVTALYEIVPTCDSKAGKDREEDLEANGELFTVYLRHKKPDAENATEFQVPVKDGGADWTKASSNLRWASAVAMFGMQLRGSAAKDATDWDLVEKVANTAKDDDKMGYRAEFMDLLKKARKLLPAGGDPKAPDEEF
ncbi:MAG: von Willebrand factor type A domain-containing protein [Planctomycetes bacterium]|nr:von Willebrand factor type A domain-containing protein [Planctomycetota bacterium]